MTTPTPRSRIIDIFCEETGIHLEEVNASVLTEECAVWPDGTLCWRDNYTPKEWEDVCNADVCRFQENSKAGILLAFMLINAGLGPNLTD